jgi:cytochrome b
VGLVVTGNIGGNWMIWHFRLGYCVLSLLIFRLLWGFLGGHWSRFSSFVPGPTGIIRYLKGGSSDGIGHNPLGALSVLAMLAVLLLQVGSGLFADDEIAFMGPLSRFASGEWVTRLTWYHKEVGKFILLLLVGIHLMAIAFYRFKKNEQLVAAMVHGDKVLPQHAAVPFSDDSARRRWIALIMFTLIASAVASFVIWLG